MWGSGSESGEGDGEVMFFRGCIGCVCVCVGGGVCKYGTRGGCAGQENGIMGLRDCGIAEMNMKSGIHIL